MHRIIFTNIKKVATIIGALVIFNFSGLGQNSVAIPSALGFAKHVRGAYAGSDNPAILIVNTLAGETVSTAEDKGSLRWALTQNYPRIILFEVSGYINLNNYLRVTNPYVSIYGQTAPGKGITITGSYVDLRTDHVVLQHLRFRLNSSSSAQEDALTIFAGSNVFIDHCSFSFALDENIGVAGTFEGPLTISNCILSHPIYSEDSKGILMSGSFDNISVIRNAFVHCGQRSPFIKETSYTTVEIVNNLCYNAEYYGIMFDSGNDPEINIIGNQWKPGNNSVSPQNRGAIRIRENMDLDSKFYIKDNLCPGRIEGSEWDITVKIDVTDRDSNQFYQGEPFDYTPLDNIYPASELLTKLKNSAGAFYWDRDPVDSVAIDDMIKGNGNWLATPNETFYPSIPKTTSSLNIPDSPHLDEDKNGFTNLEEWLFNMANTSTYIVTFNDWDGIHLSQQAVESGKSAIVPKLPTREGYTFSSWDKDFSNVTSNLTITAKYNAITGIENIMDDNVIIKVYPCPAKDEVTIEIKHLPVSQANNLTITIFNIAGNIVYQATASNLKQTINIGDLVKGEYFVKVGSFVQKIIKE